LIEHEEARINWTTILLKTAMTLDKVQLIENTGVVAGSYTNPNMTVTSDGRITSISSNPTPGPTGSIIQTVTGTYSTVVQHFFVWGQTGLQASITPTSVDSKILVVVNQPLFLRNQSKLAIRLSRGSTVIYDPSITTTPSSTSTAPYLINADNVDVSMATAASFQYLDSPNTTSPIIYSTQAWGSSGGASFTNSGAVNRTIDDPAISQITLYEIYYP
jgi:hypothetical protein